MTIPQPDQGDRALIETVTNAIEDGKGVDPVVIDLTGKSVMADAMIIVTGTSLRHLQSIADKVVQAVKHKLQVKARLEGDAEADWILVDAGDVVVHVFKAEVRDFYGLEEMWQIEAAKPKRSVGASTSSVAPA